MADIELKYLRLPGIVLIMLLGLGCLPAYADFGPKPSTDIDIVYNGQPLPYMEILGIGLDCYRGTNAQDIINYFIESGNCGINIRSTFDVEKPLLKTCREASKLMVQKKDPARDCVWAPALMWGGCEYGACHFGYSMPDEFRVLIYVPAMDKIFLTPVLQKRSLNDYFKIDLADCEIVPPAPVNNDLFMAQNPPILRPYWPPQRKLIHELPEGMRLRLIHQVPPVFPPEARWGGDEDMRVDIVIDEGGNVIEAVPYIKRNRSLTWARRDEALAWAARDAALQWKYEPMLIEGEPVQIKTTITVSFRLERTPAAGGTIVPASPARQTPPTAEKIIRGVPLAAEKKLSGFFQAFAITLFLELLATLWMIKRQHLPTAVLLYVVIANILSLPVVWFALPLLSWPDAMVIAQSEIFAFAFEAGLFYALGRLAEAKKDNSGISGRRSLGLSLLNNSASFILGGGLPFLVMFVKFRF